MADEQRSIEVEALEKIAHALSEIIPTISSVDLQQELLQMRRDALEAIEPFEPPARSNERAYLRTYVRLFDGRLWKSDAFISRELIENGSGFDYWGMMFDQIKDAFRRAMKDSEQQK